MKYVHFIVLIILTLLMLEAKAKLTIEPVNPTVCTGQSILLQVSGAETNIFWDILSEEGKAVGQIQGEGTMVTYTAPDEPGTYRMIVMDNSDHEPAQAIITVTPFSSECQLPPPSDCEHHWNAAIVIPSIEEDPNMGYGQTETLDFMIHQVRQTLKARFYCDHEIYPHSLQTQSFTWQEVEAAFEWAKQQSLTAKSKNLPEQALLIVLIGYALPGHFFLKTTEGDQPKDFLKDYQESTGNQIVIILEAPYSGTFIPILKGDQRLIITSTGEQLAHYANLGRLSFIQFFFEQLRKGTHYEQALQRTRTIFAQLPPPFNQQKPQLEDSTQGILAAQCLNRCFGELPGPALEIRTINEVVNPNKQIDFQIDAIDAQSVEAWIITPQITAQMGLGGYSRQPPIRIKLREEPKDSGRWVGSYHGFEIGGDYQINFSALNSHYESLLDCFIDGNLQSDCSIHFTVEGPTMVYPTLKGEYLNIPAVAIPNSLGGEVFYQTQLSKLPNSETRFELGPLDQVDYNPWVQTLNYNPLTSSVDLSPSFNARLELVLPLTDPLQFEWVPIP